MHNLIRLGSVAGALVLTACGTPGAMQKADRNVNDTKAAIQSQRDAHTQHVLPILEELPGSWITQRALANNDNVLPPAFTSAARFVAAEPIGLPDMVAAIAHMHGIPIRLSRDVLDIPATRATNQDSRSESGRGRGVDQAALGGGFAVNYSGTLRGLLDTIADRSGTFWAYRDGVVEFSRLLSRTFQIKTMPGTSSYAATVGKAASGSTNGEGGAQLSFGANSSISMSSSMDYWQELLRTIRSMLSSDGAATPSSMTNSITVTDIPAVVERVQKLVDNENAVLGRQVGMRVQVYTVNVDDRSSSGVEWRLAFERAGLKLGVSGPRAGNSSSAASFGSMKMDVLTGRMKGSQLVLNALSSLAKVGTMIDTTVVTLNNQPAPIAVTENQGYVASTSVSGGGIGGVPVVTMEQAVLTTGFILNLLPTILDNRSIMLQVQIDLSDLKDIKEVKADGSVFDNSKNTGEGDKQIALTTIQTPHTSAIQTMQRAALTSGDTLILAGFTRSRDANSRNGVSNYEGGTKSAEQIEEQVIILITPELVKGV